LLPVVLALIVVFKKAVREGKKKREDLEEESRVNSKEI
jgi:hypothetical protein